MSLKYIFGEKGIQGITDENYTIAIKSFSKDGIRYCVYHHNIQNDKLLGNQEGIFFEPKIIPDKNNEDNLKNILNEIFEDYQNIRNMEN